jgi:2-polyprenyl-3-methyl-5-hydroxy-6-metoxy-1,4-benzoquinol methylase
MGCPRRDKKVLTSRDRLHNLPGEFTVVQCQNCGLMRTNPRPTRQTIAFYYPDDYGPHQVTPFVNASTQKQADNFWNLAAMRILDTESRKIPALRPGRMLEIGCASGAFLQLMAGRGWHVEGLETSEKAGKAARALGYSIRIGRLEDVPDPTELFDLVVGWHVLEHLYDPGLALRRLYGWTKPGGWLALSMPDASAWEFRVFAERWYSLDLPRHLFHFTPETLKSLLAKTGWKTERLLWHHNPNNLLHSLRYFCSDRGCNRLGAYLLDIVQGRRQRYLRLFLAKFLGTLHASGRMTVWARRV